MNIQLRIQSISVITLLLFLLSCQPQAFELEEFDINLPKSEITGFTPQTALIGSEVTLSGTNLDDKALKVYIGSVECTVLENTATSAKIKLPRVIENAAFVSFNSLGARAESTEKFVPIFPETKVNLDALSDTIFKSAGYIITGENLDMITEVIFSDTTIIIDGSTVKDPTTLSISAKEGNPLKAKFKASENISFKTRSGNDVGKKLDIVVMDTYPSTKLVAIDSKTASIGTTVKFIFDNYDYAKLINSIKVGGIAATFSFDEPYVLVTIPEGAENGEIEVKNVYGVSLKYADGLLLTIN